MSDVFPSDLKSVEGISSSFADLEALCADTPTEQTEFDPRTCINCDTVENTRGERHVVTARGNKVWGTRNDTTSIVSWKFDEERECYMIKRRNHKVEYFKSFKDILSLPKLDLRELSRLELINRGRNAMADQL
jgi:hypothetical protein